MSGLDRIVRVVLYCCTVLKRFDAVYMCCVQYCSKAVHRTGLNGFPLTLQVYSEMLLLQQREQEMRDISGAWCKGSQPEPCHQIDQRVISIVCG